MSSVMVGQNYYIFKLSVHTLYLHKTHLTRTAITEFIMCLAPWAGKMNWNSHCDRLPERARSSYLARSGYGLCPARKICFGVLSYIINPLLTKLVRSRWLHGRQGENKNLVSQNRLNNGKWNAHLKISDIPPKVKLSSTSADRSSQ